MKISAQLDNGVSHHRVVLDTNGVERSISMPGKEGGGSAVNGGELLCLALATCYCNDLYREAAKRGMTIDRVEVNVQAEFGGEGEPAGGITYSAMVEADASDDDIRDLITHTDTVAEIQNTLRNSTNVTLQIR